MKYVYYVGPWKNT